MDGEKRLEARSEQWMEMSRVGSQSDNGKPGPGGTRLTYFSKACLSVVSANVCTVAAAVAAVATGCFSVPTVPI